MERRGHSSRATASSDAETGVDALTHSPMAICMHCYGRLPPTMPWLQEVIKTSDTLAFAQMMQRMMPRVKDFLTDQLSKAEQISKADPPEEIDMVDA